ncbi:MAG: hypothetical protein ISS45_00095 [Candidatus Omnitrophica bacterium]|nr:hypothetical protein [Candidatus Omnitrophota bacterium]
MKTDFKNNPRIFKVKGFKVKDYGKIYLKDGEMVSFVTESGREWDFAARKWGLYVGPSVNSRLKKEGFKVALVLNEQGQLYVNAVEEDKIEEFKEYLKTNQNNKIISWLDEWMRD